MRCCCFFLSFRVCVSFFSSLSSENKLELARSLLLHIFPFAPLPAAPLPLPSRIVSLSELSVAPFCCVVSDAFWERLHLHRWPLIMKIFNSSLVKFNAPHNERKEEQARERQRERGRERVTYQVQSASTRNVISEIWNFTRNRKLTHETRKQQSQQQLSLAIRRNPIRQAYAKNLRKFTLQRVGETRERAELSCKQ